MSRGRALRTGSDTKTELDFTTAPNHVDPPAFGDEQIGVGDGLTTQFQLVTTYLSGGTTVIRPIKKPVFGTTLIGVAGAQVTTGFTVNATTGIVLFTVAPTTGQILTAGTEFDVPVRFGDDVDRQLPMTIEAFQQTSIGAIILVELMDENPIDEDFWFGAGRRSARSARTPRSRSGTGGS